MDRAIPEINRPIAQKQLYEAKRAFKSRLREAKGFVDNAMPNAMMHPIVKLKKEQMIEGKSVSFDKN